MTTPGVHVAANTFSGDAPASLEFAAWASSVTDGLMLLSGDGVILEANSAAAELLGRGAGALAGERLGTVVGNDWEHLRGYLRLCAGTTGALPGALLLDDEHGALRCECARLQGRDPPLLLIRLWRRNPESFVLLTQKLEELNDEIARRRRIQERLERLQSLAQALSPKLSIADVAEVVVSRGTILAGADACALRLLSEDGCRLELVRQVGYPASLVETLGVAVSVSDELPSAAAVRRGAPLFVESPKNLRREFPSFPLEHVPGHALSVLPLFLGDDCLGVMILGYAHPREFPADERRLLASFAYYCAQALHRARLFESERRARLEALDAERRKDEFLARLGHELRNPLSPILTAVQLMAMRGEPGFERERAVIERQARHLALLVDDLLDVSRITRGTIALEKETGDLRQTINAAVEMSSPLFEERAHRLELELASTGLVVYADHHRLTQVVANLLNNAAKYTDPGGRIGVTAERVEDYVVMRIRDDGRGIAPELLPHIFDSFVQEGANPGRNPGLGLGLAIVKSLVALHGGVVTAHSEGPGRGSEFVIRLPVVAEAPASDPRARPEPPLPR